MDLLRAIIECLTGNPPKAAMTHPRAAHDIAADVLTTILTTDTIDEITKKKLDETVGEYGWTQEIGKAILHGLVEAIKAGAEMAEPAKNAIERATAAAVGFAKEHPVYFTIIALGVMVILAPWVIEALGFGELGPIEGSFATIWQRTYAGYVPKGSLFSYFQRLGMTWKH